MTDAGENNLVVSEHGENLTVLELNLGKFVEEMKKLEEFRTKRSIKNWKWTEGRKNAWKSAKSSGEKGVSSAFALSQCNG